MLVDQYQWSIKSSYPVRKDFLFLRGNLYFFIFLGEYIGGALRWEDLILYATEAGFTQPRLVTAKPITITNEDIEKAVGKAKFVSAIFRCFKLPITNEQESTQFNIPYQLTYETPLLSSEQEFFFDHLLQFKVKKCFLNNRDLIF